MTRCLIFSALLCVVAASLPAEEIIDYVERLDALFKRSQTVNSVQVTAMPQLIERAFANFIKEQSEKKATRQAIVKQWLPRYAALQRDGYVFAIEFLLLNQNLDSNVEVAMAGDLRRRVFLINSKGETGMAYKVTSDNVAKLDFMYPKKVVTCYFNTVNARGVPLLRNGIMSLTLKVVGMGAALPDTTFTWNVPLFYDATRPQAMAALFGAKPLRTLIPLKSNVWQRVDLAPEVPHAPAAPPKPAAPTPAAPRS